MIFRSFILATSLIWGYQVHAACVDTEGLPSEKMRSNQQECLKKARYILEQPNSQSDSFRAELTNPESKKDGFVNGSIVYCRYHYQKQNGQSAKFRCARTNEQNQLLNSKGEVVPLAVGLVTDGDDVYLTDKDNQKLVQESKSDKSNKTEKKKYVKAWLMKVRYQNGDDRNVENYTSSAASRIFTAMGIPAHANYMTQKVVCFGCGPSPFRDQQAPVYDGAQLVKTEFIDASIEVKFNADRLYDPTQSPWKWEEINKLYVGSTNEIRTEIEVLALASQFIGAIGKTDMQNAIVCTKFSKENKSECESVIAMAHDLGASFGSRTDKKFLHKTFPRGDLSFFKKSRIFKEGTCSFLFTDDGKELPADITSAGKAEFLKRASVLTKENLKTIFSASHMGRLNNSNENNISTVEDKWVEAVLAKIKEVQEAPCK